MHLPLYKIEISGIIIIVRCASVAQSVEQGTENPRVIGSIPIGGTSQETQQGFQYAAVAHLVERHLAKVEVASSSLVGRSISEIWFQAAGLHLVQALQANQVGSFLCGPVVQLVRTLACHARGRQFEPDPGRHYASVAQSVEQGTENPRVIGSIPIGGTSQETQQGFQYAAVAHLVERHLAKVEVASSSLVGRSRQTARNRFTPAFCLLW